MTSALVDGDDGMRKMRILPLVVTALACATFACSTTELMRDMLGRLPTATPATELTSLTIWYVAPDGDDTNTCREPLFPCLTIQEAIDRAGDDDIIEIDPGTYAERAPGIAAGIFVDGKTLSLHGSGVEATYLEAMFPWHVAVVLRDAEVEIMDLTIQGGGEASGSGLNGSRVDLRLTDVVIQDNEGRGFIVQDGRSTFEFSNVTVQRNGRANSLEGEGSITASQILDNRDTGIINGASLTLTESRIEGNRAENGPAIVNNPGARLTIERSTIARNTATATTHSLALGIGNEGTMTLVNSTVSNNGAVSGGSGGAIANRGELTVFHSTVADNRGTGILGSGGSVTFQNALIGDNDEHDCYIPGGRHNFLGGSLDGDDTCLRWFSSDRSSRDLFIEPLADNGGPTMTHALRPESPAVDAAVGDCPEVDQRGEPRPLPPDCDVGAFELGAIPMRSTEAPSLATETPEVTATPPTVTMDTLCWKGPGPAYEVVSSLEQGTGVAILGRGVEGDWWVIDNPRYPGVRCWTPGEDIEVEPNYEYPSTLFEIPPLPTATPTQAPQIEGCLYQGQNDPQALCYPIENCPVDFEDSQGACSP